MNQKMEEARFRTEKIKPWVEEWSNACTKKLEEARTILQDDINPKAWNLISRYSMGKMAKKAAEEIAKHRNDVNFNDIADPAPPPAMGSTPHRCTMDFESRKRIEEDIIKSLNESSVGMIGICGMGGVGKTTMAQRIRERVMEEKLFDEVVMVVVTQQIDMLKIQEEIADWLKLKFDERSMSARADKLQKRLMDTKRKIVIFDDVWERFKLEDLGVPFGNVFGRCKIVLTTRSKDVCVQMEVKKIITMEVLAEEEAWILFKEKAGNCVEDLVLLSVAKNVVAECKRLPIALVTVGKALRNQEKSIWVDSLSQLRRSNPSHFPEVLADVYKPLKLSYDKLDNESERLLFLLCCLFPEDYVIPVEQLTQYIMGLQIIDDITSIEEARNRTHRLVEKLKSRFLLIDGGKKHHVKMHDVVRDVAIFIGSKEKYGFLQRLNKISIQNSSDINCNWMSVDISNETMNVDMGLRFPKLRLLMLLGLRSYISSEEIGDLNVSLEGTGDLNVLSFSDSIGSLPPTLGLLQNLRTLYLYRCKVEDISVVGELAGLEILYCYYCDEIKELPAEIGRLNRLRLLELNECFNLERIAFGILSSLVRLEELKMLESFVGWEAEENGKENRNASIRELESLINLSCLEIEISDSNLAAQEIHLSSKLVKYKVYIASQYSWISARDYDKAMIFKLPSEIGAVGKWIQNLVKNTEYLFLEGDGSNNINLEECQDLRKLMVDNCSTLKKVVKTKDCKSAFCQISGLQTIKFPNLTKMRIEKLPKLNSFCPLNSETSHDDRNPFHFLCNPKVEIGGLKTLTVWSFNYKNIRNMWCHLIPINFFNNLETLVIGRINGIRSLMPYSIAKNLVNLKSLGIRGCSEMVEVIEGNDAVKEVVDIKCLFSTLETLEFEELPKLRRFWQLNHTLELPLLEEVSIKSCPVMETFTLGSLNAPNLIKLVINSQAIDYINNLNDILVRAKFRVY